MIRQHAAVAISLVAIATALGCATARLASEGDAPLRVMSYNIAAAGGNLDNVVQTIRDLAPDIVGLQEVDVHWLERSHFADQAAELASRLGMQVHFAPIYHIPNANPALPIREFGVALLSRFPIIDSRNDSLTRHSTQTPNAPPSPMPGLLQATLDVNGRQVRVFSTHLDYRADPRVRTWQVAEMIAYIRRSSAPTLLLGDLNATPEAAELQPLFQVLRDTWPASEGPGLTYPADKPVKRIDYVLASSHFVVRSAAVPVTSASDHRPVIVELRLSKAP